MLDSGKQRRYSAIHMHVTILPQTLFLSSLPHYTPQSSLCYTVGPYWSYTLNIAVFSVQLSSVQSLSHVQLFATPGIATLQASLPITNSQSPPKPMSFESVMPSNRLILCHPLLLLPSIFPSTRVFTNESALCIRWPKYQSFNFNISFSNEHPGLIIFRMDWLDLLAVQGALKSLLQRHSSRALIFLCSALRSNSHFHT